MLTAVYRDSELWKTFAYNAQNKIIEEGEIVAGEKAFVHSYSYTEAGKLFAVDGKNVVPTTASGQSVLVDGYHFISSGDSATVTVSGDVTASFVYGYEFNGVKYLTSKTVNGVTTEYAYLGDKVVGI